MLLSSLAFAQKGNIDTDTSNVEWVGKKIGGQHEGTIKIKSGNLELEGKKIISGNIVIDMTTIVNTDLSDKEYQDKLVGHLNSGDFFGVEKFPTANIVLSKESKFKKNKAQVTGKLTIKGKTENITFDLVKTEGKYIATIDIDRSKFDIRYGSNSFFDNLGDKAIADIFTIKISLVIK